jgi:dipeptidyl aminopeptidase/acylaminoacyl peptidase
MFDHTLLTFSGLAAVGMTLALGMGSANAGSVEEQVELIPRDVFFGNPDRASLRISPDGKHLAYLAPRNGVLNVWVQTLGKDDARPITNAKERPIMSFFWAENSEQIIYAIDTGGDENFRLYAATLDGGDEIALTPFDNVQARVVATDRDYPDEILAAVNNRIPQLHDVIRINTRTGEREGVYMNNEGYVGFVPDSDFNIRIAIRYRPDGGTDAFHRDSNDGEWELFASWDMEDSATSSPVEFTRDGSTLYMIDSSRANTSGLYAGRFDDEGQFTTELIARNPRADVSNAVVDPATGLVQAVSFEYDRVEWMIIDSSIEPDWRTLRNVTDGDFDIISRSRDDRHWIVAYVVDNGPVRYYHYDRDAGEVAFLFTNRSSLEGKQLANMKPVVIEARDGLKLVSYLTLPLQSEGRNLPMVLLVHGGPWARDRWGYNPMHQWLANRGYAVLSVNFRGSTGFGKDFLNAGNREWAGKMHDDLIDAVEWAINEGIADSNRVAIMGGSYGGYATLVGMTFTPDVFAAGVSIVGPSHIRTLLESIPPYWEPVKAMFESRVGSLEEPEYLDEISPLTRVDEIRRPLLIGQGANDPRVKEAESEQIVAAMQERTIPVTYVVFPDEGHGFARPENRMAFYAVTEAFLAEHLGGRYEPITDEIGNSSAKVPAGAGLIPGLVD